MNFDGNSSETIKTFVVKILTLTFDSDNVIFNVCFIFFYFMW